MRTELRITLASWIVVALAATTSLAGLCGDTTGDGYLLASDARRSLRMAVASEYDRRGDVFPKPGIEAGDGKIAASDALETLRASVENRIPACHGANERLAVVTTAPYDFYSSAGLAVVDVATRTFEYRAGALDGDSVIRTPGGLPIAVNRHNFNSLQVVDADDDDLDTIKACSVDDGFNSNPQDIVLLSDTKGYVTPYAGGDLFVISTPVLLDPGTDPACNGIVTGYVDLSSLDGDGIPQMDQMAIVGSELFVSLQLLDDTIGGLPPKQNSILAVIDTLTDTVTGTIPLGFANPFGETKGLPYDEFQRLLFAGGPGNVSVLDDGGIEAIDPVAKQSVGMVMTGADIDRNIFDFVIVGTDRAFAIVADDTSNAVVELSIGLDPADRRIKRTLLSSTAMISDLEMTERGELWVAYRGETKQDPPGIRIFDVVTGAEKTAGQRIVLGQAPFTLAFVD